MSGIFAMHDVDDAGLYIALGLHGLQHLGTEGAGITTTENEALHTQRGLGLVGYVFGQNNSRSSTELFRRLRGRSGIGYVKSPADSIERTTRNVQPLFAQNPIGDYAIALTGGFTDAHELKNDLQLMNGAVFQTSIDTEIIIHLIAHSAAPTFEGKLIEALKKVSGAFSLVASTSEGIIAVRDPRGFRPLVLGQIVDSGAWILASESCAFDIIGAKYKRDIKPGEMVVIDSGGIKSCKPFDSEPGRLCMFESIHLARPDSISNGESYGDIRYRIGEQLARECPADADVVVPVPESGVHSALGFSAASGIPFNPWITRNHYTGSTFTEPEHKIRDLGLLLKYNPCRNVFKGMHVVIVDDCVLRGTTARRIVKIVKRAGAAEVHLRIASPRIVHTCPYGVGIPEKSALIASSTTVEKMREHLDVDSLAFASIESLYEAVAGGKNFCDACMTGNNPCSSSAGQR